MRRAASPLILAAVAVALLAAACVNGSGGLLSGDTPPGHVSAGPKLQGGKVILSVGQYLSVSPGKGERWRVLSYPRSSLRLTGGQTAGHTFLFLAYHSGEGSIAVALFGRCPRPLPGADTLMATVPCPVGGPNEDRSNSPGLLIKPTRVYRLEVRVR